MVINFICNFCMKSRHRFDPDNVSAVYVLQAESTSETGINCLVTMVTVHVKHMVCIFISVDCSGVLIGPGRSRITSIPVYAITLQISR